MQYNKTMSNSSAKSSSISKLLTRSVSKTTKTRSPRMSNLTSHISHYNSPYRFGDVQKRFATIRLPKYNYPYKRVHSDYGGKKLIAYICISYKLEFAKKFLK
jgi:hypothetical protein